MPFGENGCQIDEETRKRLNEMLGGTPKQDRVLGQDLVDVRSRLEAELDAARRANPEVLEDVSVSRADVLRRTYTDRYV